ncbi:MAG: serine hydrolase [bacterium]
MQAALDSSIRANNIVGASAAIIVPDQGTWLGTSGYSVPATSDTIRSDMLFGIASITKTYTAAMILKLADDGILSLDDSLHRWIPSFQHVDSTITIRQLLQHTSGIYDYMEHPDWFISLIADLTRSWPPEEILSNFLNPPYFPPGASWKYSNTNYIVAGMIIKAATGNTVSTELHSRFLDPQGLSNTFLEMVDTLTVEIVHSWADRDFDGELDDLYPNTNFPAVNSMTWTAGAMIATAEDLAKWAGLLYSGAFFSQAYMDEMLFFYPIPTPLITGYGLGAIRFEYRGKTFWGHNGSLPGINAIMLYSPKDGVSIVVLLNQRPGDGSSGYVFSVAIALVDAYLDYVATGVADSNPPSPGDFTLHQNYPNPFNPETAISYQLPVASEVQLIIYNALGQKIRSLVNGQQSPGLKSVVWDGKNDLGQPVSSGIYFYTLKAGERAQTKKMLLIR